MSYRRGEFCDHVNYAAESFRQDDNELIRLWGEWLELFHPVVLTIAYGDELETLLASLHFVPDLLEKLGDIQAYLTLRRQDIRIALEKYDEEDDNE